MQKNRFKNVKKIKKYAFFDKINHIFENKMQI